MLNIPYYTTRFYLIGRCIEFSFIMYSGAHSLLKSLLKFSYILHIISNISRGHILEYPLIGIYTGNIYLIPYSKQYYILKHSAFFIGNHPSGFFGRTKKLVIEKFIIEKFILKNNNIYYS